MYRYSKILGAGRALMLQYIARATSKNLLLDGINYDENSTETYLRKKNRPERPWGKTVGTRTVMVNGLVRTYIRGLR